jgi:oligosaccharide repeat unit polymerase
MAASRARVVRLEALFSPYVLVPGLGATLLVIYLATPGTVFEREFQSPKWDTPWPAVFYTLALAAFGIGALAGDVMARRPRARAEGERGELVRARMRRLCLVALLVSVGAYALWWGRGIANAGGIGELVRTYARNPELVRTEYLTTIPGVTTLTQLAVAAIPLAIAYRLFDRRLVVVLVGLVFVLALARSVLDSERLALLELLIPAAYLAVAGRRIAPLRLVAAAGLLALAVVAFFVGNELRRKGAYGDFALTDALWRFAGYYLGTVNNTFAMIDHHAFATPLYFTGQALWEFPGMRQLGVTPENLLGIDAPRFIEDFFRLNGLSPAVNTFGVLGSVSADFGWLALLWLLGVGAAAGALYRAATRSAFYRALYAVWLVGLLEFVRIYYFFSTRLVPAYLVFAVALVIVEPRLRARVGRGSPTRWRASQAPESGERRSP